MRFPRKAIIPADEPDLGTKFGPYEIVSLVDAGGMGEVYRARDSRLKREVRVARRGSVYASSSRGSERTAKVYQVNIANGKMDLWRDFGARVAVGVGEIGGPYLASGSNAYAYVYARTLSQAYVVTGLKQIA